MSFRAYRLHISAFGGLSRCLAMRLTTWTRDFVLLPVSSKAKKWPWPVEIRHKSQDRLQNLQSIPGSRYHSIGGTRPKPLSPSQQDPVSGGSLDPSDQEGIQELGRTQDPRETPQGVSDDQSTRCQFNPCNSGSPRSSESTRASPLQSSGHTAERCGLAQRALVRGLQRAVPSG